MIIRFLLLLTLFSLCSCEKKQSTKEQRPTVLVSVPPYAFFVRQIAKDAVNVETLVPAGANPHIYEASPKEVQRHQSAVVWIYLGEAFDKRVLEFFKKSQKKIQILDITKGIDLLSICEESMHCQHAHDDGFDLHIWLSPTLAKLQAQKIASTLIALLPEQQERFLANLQIFLNELDELDHQIAHLLKPFRGKAILASHPAFAYFCKDYHLIQIAIEMEGKDPLPQQITKVLAQAKQYSIQSILVEPQYSNKGAEFIAQSLDLPTHLVDPYAENYLENLLAIAKVIAE